MKRLSLPVLIVILIGLLINRMVVAVAILRVPIPPISRPVPPRAPLIFFPPPLTMTILDDGGANLKVESRIIEVK
jgi:hypothetical protein